MGAGNGQLMDAKTKGNDGKRDNGLPHRQTYFDVTGNTARDSAPVGSINRARQQGEVASRKARIAS